MHRLPDSANRSSAILSRLAMTIARAINSPATGHQPRPADDWIPVTSAAWQRARRLVRRVRCDAAGRAGRIRHTARARTRRARRTAAKTSSSSSTDGDGPGHTHAASFHTERAA